MDFCCSVLTGLIANVFVLIMAYCIQKYRYRRHLSQKFHNKTFHTYWKNFPKEIVQRVTCKVKNNRIQFSGIREGKTDVFEGEFIINPLNLKAGEGFHSHTESDRFAFSKIIIKDDNTFYIDAPYTKIVETVDEKGRKSKSFSMVYQAFVWRKQDKQ